MFFLRNPLNNLTFAYKCEVRLRLGNKNKRTYFVLLSACTNFALIKNVFLYADNIITRRQYA